MIKSNAMDLIEQHRLVDRRKEQDSRTEALEKKRSRARYLMHKLLSGEHMTAEEGREVFYECIVNSDAMRMEEMTGNSYTYWVLGYKEWPKQLIEAVKKWHFDLWQKCEKEHYDRTKKEVE